MACVYLSLNGIKVLIGILASRMKERYHRPVIAFADAGGGLLKGSARSIPGLRIRDTLDAVAARFPELISKFGGHAMAAGLSLQAVHYEAFAKAFDAEVRRQLTADDLTGRIYSDGCLAATRRLICSWRNSCVMRGLGGNVFLSLCFMVILKLSVKDWLVKST